jgi:hypothetical protein
MGGQPSAIAVDAVAWTELDDESVLLQTQTGLYFGLDAVGTDIWREVSDGTPEDEIVARLAARYDADPPQIRADLASFLVALRANGLIKDVDG